MFVYSVRASTIRFFAVITLMVALVFTWFIIDGETAVFASAGESYDFTGGKTEEGRQKFLSQFGIKTEGAPVETADFCLPTDFDRVLGGYNEIQKSMGLNLSKYKGRKLTRYTYRVTNADVDGEVYVNLLVKRNLIVGADVSSTAPGGFVKPLSEFKGKEETAQPTSPTNISETDNSPTE